jgi:hypothetical protein
MREYDENIRLYTPILQRVIILVAVIIAVPVVLWTITSFVRSYVAPPQIPTFRPLAGSTIPESRGPAPQSSSAVQFAAQTGNGATASDARTMFPDIKKPGSPPTAPSASVTTPAISGMTASAGPPQPLQTASAIVDPTAWVNSAPKASPPSPSVAAPPNLALASATPLQAATAPPNPATIAPIDPSLDAQPASIGAPSEQMAASDAAAGDLPAGKPLKGRIPLPTRRPVTAGSTAMAAHVALAAGGVPLPRARPAAAPEPAPVVDTPAAYDPSQIH